MFRGGARSIEEGDETMTKVRLHTLPIRVWHWTNAFLIVFLILTGIQLRAPDLTLFGSYSNAVWLHKYAGFGATGSFVFWLIYVLLSGAFWRHYVLRPSDVKRMPKQAAFYGFSIFRGKENPFTASPRNKFNPMQKVAYFSMMSFVTPVVVITGILFSDILYFLPYIEAIGGLQDPRCYPRHRGIRLFPLPACPSLHGHAGPLSLCALQGDDRGL